MLQDIGDKLQAHKWLSYSVMGVLALIFAVWGAYGLVEFTRSGGTNAAVVDGYEIKADEVARAWQQQQPQYARLFGGEIPPAQRDLLKDQLLDGFVRQAAVVQRTQRLGLRVTRAQIQDAWRSEPAFQEDGKFDPRVAYARLAGAGVTPQQYEAEKKRSLLTNQLGEAIVATEFLTPSEAKRLFTLEGEERELRYLVLTPEKFAAGPAFDAAAIEAAYQADQAQYMLPESARLEYAELSLADVAAQTTVGEDQLRERYEMDKDRYVDPERRQARHILIAVEAGADDAAAKAQAEALYARARAGEDFAKLARENSKDQGSAAQGGDLGMADRSVYVAPFADALFSLASVGAISAPVKTQFGWHVIKLEAIQAGHSKSFAEVRGELDAELRQQVAAEEFGNRQEQLQQRIERGAGDLDSLVQAFGLRRGEVADFTRGDGGAPVGNDPNLNADVFSEASKQGKIGGPVALGEDRLVVFKVLETRPSQLRPLAEVRDQVVAKLTRERGVAEARKAAEAALARLEAGEDLGKIAGSLKLAAMPARFVGRGDSESPPEVREATFQRARPEPGKPLRRLVELREGTAVVEVSASRTPPVDDVTPMRQQVAQRELARRGNGYVEAYLGELMRVAKVKKHPEVLE